LFQKIRIQTTTKEAYGNNLLLKVDDSITAQTGLVISSSVKAEAPLSLETDSVAQMPKLSSALHSILTGEQVSASGCTGTV
jgi:hypothetical protein